MREQSRSWPSPVGVGPIETGLEIPVESAGKGMKTPVEDQMESGKTDYGANQDLANSSEGGLWE